MGNTSFMLGSFELGRYRDGLESKVTHGPENVQFIADYLRRSLSISELCAHYGISRKSGYK